MCLQAIYLIYMYKQDFALNNLQQLICHKTKPNQTKSNIETSNKNNVIRVILLKQWNWFYSKIDRIVLALRVRVNLGAMAMKEYSLFPTGLSSTEGHFYVLFFFTTLDFEEKKLNRPQQTGVIQLKNYFAWVAPTDVVKKSSVKFCICEDFSTSLNDSLDAHHNVSYQKIFLLNITGKPVL